MQQFENGKISNWIFDLDNTLYPAECNLFAQIDQRMGDYISRMLDVDLVEARRVQKDYYYRFGTTLNGLMQVHKLDPHDYLDFVHDIDHSVLPHSPLLREEIAKLEGRKFIFTNGSTRHGEQVAERLGLLDLFDGIFDIAAADFTPKPNDQAYERFLKRHDVAPEEAAMFEDLHPNLKVPHARGMTTVLVNSSYEDHPAQKEKQGWAKLPDYVHFETDDLTGFLTDVNKLQAPKD
ncbi:MAG: pyrimidine 5'-nucleotidase [Rhodomicrobium sp.]|nr:MAG: pyrimidine 5'-nucleotidase [Rhodomicrobium sp.]